MKRDIIYQSVNEINDLLQALNREIDTIKTINNQI